MDMGMGVRKLGIGVMMAILAAIVLLVMLMPVRALAQAKQSGVAKTVVVAAVPAERDLDDTQRKLLELLRVSPTLAGVVASDPALLSNQEYVAKMNPELAQFLSEHPEIARNPAFYLFSDLRTAGHQRYELMEPKEGFVGRRDEDRRNSSERELDEIAPFFAMVLCGLAGGWLIKTLTENRRWTRIFKLQAEVHGHMMAKFGTSQELMAYMETEAGRRFLEATPIATETDQKRLPNVASRVLLNTQIGVVLSLLGIGMLFLRNHVGDGGTTMLVLGTMVLMPGIGFMISAAITWELAKRLGVMPEAADVAGRQ